MIDLTNWDGTVSGLFEKPLELKKAAQIGWDKARERRVQDILRDSMLSIERQGRW